MIEHKLNIIKYFNSFSGRYRLYDVFSDFLQIAAITISNSIDKKFFSERESEYMKIISKYYHTEVDLFPKIFSELVIALEKHPGDILGEIYMELGLGNKNIGQVFTPASISKLCSELMVDYKRIKSIVATKGYISVSEPACGGGSMIIEFALALKKNLDFNYQEHMLVDAIDLDIKAVYMCYIQLSLLGIPAVVSNGDTLSLKVFSEWRTPMFILNSWEYRMNKYKVS